MRYLEVGTIGCSTEIEWSDGTEIRLPGLLAGSKVVSAYLRFQVGHKLIVLDTREGIKNKVKPRWRLLCVVGLVYQ
jgi:hypothetical protein